jgi:hypothetical protein
MRHLKDPRRTKLLLEESVSLECFKVTGALWRMSLNSASFSLTVLKLEIKPCIAS